MPAKTDAKFAALRAQGHTGAMPEMTLQWLQNAGAVSDCTSTAWAEMLTARGYRGQLNGSWYNYLGELGHNEPDLPSREKAFWASGGILGPPEP